MLEGLSIIIPVCRDLKGLKETVADIHASQIPIKFEILVCNDGADASITQWCQNLSLTEVVITPRRGSYFARNRGIEQAQFDHLLFVDADVKVQPGWFQLIKPMIERNDYIAFNINILSLNKDSINEKYSAYTEFRCDLYWDKQHFGPTAFLFMTKSIFNELGMFDERLKSGGDLELGNRCWYAHKSMAFVENDKIWHRPRNLIQKFRKHIRVMMGQRQLLSFYPDRIFHISPHHLRRWFRIPFSFLKIATHLSETEAYQQGKFNKRQILWCEFCHHLAYFCAYFVVFFKKSNH